MKAHTIWTLILSLCYGMLTGQDLAIPSFQVKKTNGKVTLDGVLDEPGWINAQPVNSLWQYFPVDTVKASEDTEVRIMYDETMLYVSAKCYAKNENYLVPSLRRDFRGGGIDGISFLFDTFNDRTNAFMFGMNPLGVRREALISGGGSSRQEFSSSWDNKWDGEAKAYDGYWIVEMAIPFKTLRYKEGSPKWRFNVYRLNPQENERSTWIKIPRNQLIFNLAFMGDMVWEEPLKKPGTNISLIPYLSGGFSQNYDAENDVTEFDYGIGGDAKIAVTPALNLDLTVNPDLSQVEVDQQITNLSRFEVFFPERRQFFLENADLFGAFGTRRINPFFSRRIGIAEDTLTEDNIQNTIIGGARLSGKLDENWRIGLLNMQTASDERAALPTLNYSVAVIQRKVFSRSNIGMIFVNKQAFENGDSSDVFNSYNRVLGVDYNHATADNRITGKLFLHRAFTTDDLPAKYAHGGKFRYNIRKFTFDWTHQWVGEGYDAEVGFVPRTDFLRFNPEVTYRFYPSRGMLSQHGIGIDAEVIFQPGFGRTDHQVEGFWDFQFNDGSRGRATLQHEYVYLDELFDPTRTDALELPAETDYNNITFRARYGSDRRKLFYFSIEPSVGTYFDGYRYRLGGDLNFRFQPYVTLRINYNYNYITLPEPYATASLFLIGPRLDITFTKSIFLTTFVQYNSQDDNFNLNARFQWRFAPVSDLFVVYTDDYDTTDFSAKSRALIVKLTYWFNL